MTSSCSSPDVKAPSKPSKTKLIKKKVKNQLDDNGEVNEKHEWDKTLRRTGGTGGGDKKMKTKMAQKAESFKKNTGGGDAVAKRPAYGQQEDAG